MPNYARGDISLNVYQRALKLYGKEAQFRLLQEECGELIVAISHYLRKSSPENKENLLEEIADVHVMFEELPYILENGDDMERIRTIKKEKVDRLRKIMNNYSG